MKKLFGEPTKRQVEMMCYQTSVSGNFEVDFSKTGNEILITDGYLKGKQYPIKKLGPDRTLKELSEHIPASLKRQLEDELVNIVLAEDKGDLLLTESRNFKLEYKERRNIKPAGEFYMELNIKTIHQYRES